MAVALYPLSSRSVFPSTYPLPCVVSSRLNLGLSLYMLQTFPHFPQCSSKGTILVYEYFIFSFGYTSKYSSLFISTYSTRDLKPV